MLRTRHETMPFVFKGSGIQKVTPEPWNTNSRGYYLEVLTMAEFMPYTHLVIFRPVSWYNIAAYQPTMPCYYVGIVATSQDLVEAVTAVNELFCEDDTRRSNSSTLPEVMVPVPVDDEYLLKPPSYTKHAQTTWEYLNNEYTYFPTDKGLTETKLSGIVERLAKTWTLG